MESPNIQATLQHFNKNTPDWYGWRKEDSNGNKIPNDQRMTFENVIVIKEGAILPTLVDLNTKHTELQAEYNSQAYARNRKAEYPTIADQLDDIFHNGIDGWKATIQVTKDKYPKE
jgi:hypothetical protein